MIWEPTWASKRIEIKFLLFHCGGARCAGELVFGITLLVILHL